MFTIALSQEMRSARVECGTVVERILRRYQYYKDYVRSTTNESTYYTAAHQPARYNRECWVKNRQKGKCLNAPTNLFLSSFPCAK